eukprot:1159975-Pelagomonas_calceolata.AAC.6
MSRYIGSKELWVPTTTLWPADKAASACCMIAQAGRLLVAETVAQLQIKHGISQGRWWYFISSIEHRAQPPSCYGALAKREEGDSKEEVSGSNPCGRGGDKDALYWWESMGGSSLNARGRTASGSAQCQGRHCFKTKMMVYQEAGDDISWDQPATTASIVSGGLCLHLERQRMMRLQEADDDGSRDQPATTASIVSRDLCLHLERQMMMVYQEADEDGSRDQPATTASIVSAGCQGLHAEIWTKEGTGEELQSAESKSSFNDGMGLTAYEVLKTRTKLSQKLIQHVMAPMLYQTGPKNIQLLETLRVISTSPTIGA